MPERSYHIADKAGKPLVTVIHLWEHWTVCHRCNADTLCYWGLPVAAETADYCAPDYDGEWGGVPACQACSDWYEAEYVKPT